ncbi:uncharacterized protein LOC119964181 [Scyliorhinus canicula]|uniref:uncharacterized protein LOC119964181 n=1 Tax=Scyliorhinus canicula TaxID=7830 RepID=UPI0018F6F45B|nr:uncharacterized protein LOC119964181 [Scyliorhinus canicula]
MRRLLGMKLGADISKIRYNWPDDNVRARQVQPDHADNVPYNAFVTGLVDACQTAFPVRMDMTKIAMCKQRDGETVSQYLTRLTEVHNAHSGLTPPADMNIAEVTPYEAHLRNSFMNRLSEDFAKKVKNTCITWDTGKLNLIEQHSIHTEKLLTQEKAKRNKRREDQSHQAQLTMMQMVTQLQKVSNEEEVEDGQEEEAEEFEGEDAVRRMGVSRAEARTTGQETVQQRDKKGQETMMTMVIDKGEERTMEVCLKERVMGNHMIVLL